MSRAILLFALVGSALASNGASDKKQPSDTDVVKSMENAKALSGEGTTPVKKVTQLLKRIQTQVETEGKMEAAQYDKFACFCKEQADDKLYAIETSVKKIGIMDAKISKLGTEISELNSQVAGLSRLIDERTWEVGNLTATRADQHQAYVEKEADASNAIDACDRAISALKASKDGLGGKANKNAFVQIQTVAKLALGMEIALGGLSESQADMLNYFASGKAPDDGVAASGEAGAAYSYTYHSNDIISIITDLRKKFIEIKDDLDLKEFELKKAFDAKVLGLTNEKKFAEEEKKVKDKIIAHKTEVKEETEDDRNKETVMKNADNDFLEKTKDMCQQKATTFDQRSSTRASELTALAGAIEQLETGVKENWSANKKLSDLQVKNKKEQLVPKGHWVYVEDSDDSQKPVVDKPLSFLQLRGSNVKGAMSEPDVKAKLLSVLSKSASTLKSSTLSVLALKVQAAEDHFVRVRQLIKDLIAQLEAQATAEQTHKMWCDKEMKKEVTNRDEAANTKEEKSASIEGKEGEVKNLNMEIADLSAQVAENKKALSEATELRQSESDENADTRAKAQAGKAAVDEAIRILKTFYDNAFLQYVPPKSDREGKTFNDLATESGVGEGQIFDSTYHGKQESSKGIIGMLEVISADFDRTDTTTEDAETVAASEFTDYKTNNEQDTSSCEGLITTKKGQISTLENDLVTLTTDLENAKTAFDLSEKSLEELSKMCVEGEETHEERVAARMKEIEALKEAHNILENWQS